MASTLNNKVAIITGGSRGIGAAIAERFAAEGAKVVLVARTRAPGGKLPGSLDETAARIRAQGGNCHCVQADLGSAGDRERIVTETVAHYGGVDILVNNAAWARFAPSYAQPPERVELAYAVNVFAPLHLSQLVIPLMKACGGGWILNLSSVTSKLPPPAPYDPNERAYRFHTTHSPTLYGSTKAALERMSAPGDGTRRRQHRGQHPRTGRGRRQRRRAQERLDRRCRAHGAGRGHGRGRVGAVLAPARPLVGPYLPEPATAA